MHSADHEVLHAALEWLEQGYGVVLATVVRTWGSSPRPVGSLMALRVDGKVVGSVSGGCVEQDLLERVRAGALDLHLPQVVRYGWGHAEHQRFDIPCNGRLEIVLETLHGTAPLRRVLQTMAARQTILRRLCLNTGEVSLHTAAGDAVFAADDKAVSKLFGPAWQLLIVGAVQVSRFLAEMALALDYRVTVCDPREEYREALHVAGVVLDPRMPDDAVRAVAGDRRSVVVALSHDPRLDDLALMAALAADTFYVGALGSRTNNDKRRARLATLGLTPAQLARLHGPVGLPIGSHTPAEIAISILAQVTALRNGVYSAVVDGAARGLEDVPTTATAKVCRAQ
jgi:xanthine dehydrogenase accessory factor